MIVIWKYDLENPTQEILMPEDARILTVQMQNESLCLWALVDTDKPRICREFQVYGTGHTIQSNVKDYLGTVQMGSLVWHVVEITSHAALLN